MHSLIRAAARYCYSNTDDTLFQGARKHKDAAQVPECVVIEHVGHPFRTEFAMVADSSR